MAADSNTNILRLHSMDHGHPSAAMDPQLMVFFTMNDLKTGKKLLFYFPHKILTDHTRFLPKEEADSIPFSLEDLPKILQRFSFSRSSPQGIAIEDALTQCGRSPISGETKICATSLESMLDYARGVFGLGKKFDILTTKYLTEGKLKTPQNYTVSGEPREVAAPKMVACHMLPYPYAVFYCHSQVSVNRVLKVNLVGENGDMVDAVAVCHMDTSQWSHKHASFQVLGIKPGSSHVCHVFPPDNMVFVPAANQQR